MDVATNGKFTPIDSAQKRIHTERENPFNKIDDAEINESDVLQQITANLEVSDVCVDRKTLCLLGIDLTSESNLEDFARHFDDTIGKCFKLELQTDYEKQKRQRWSALSTDSGTGQSAVLSMSISSSINCNCNSIRHSSSTAWYKLVAENAQPCISGWQKPYATQLYVRSLLKQRQTSMDGDNSSASESTKALLDMRRRSKYDEQFAEADEYELRACFDLHSLITAELPTNLDEPFKSADEVLAEIDQIMLDGSGMAALEADSSISQTALELLHFKEHGGATAAELESSTFVSNLRNLSVGALSEYLEELEVLIRQLSEQLVQELADREEIELERELKSEFVSLMTTLQKRQNDALTTSCVGKQPALKSGNVMSSSTGPVEQHSVLSLSSPLSRLRKFSWSTSNVANSSNASQTPAAGVNPSLFISIPYHASNGSPDCELLQRFIVLLRAVLENRANVPQLLTDYILNVYAPPSTDLQMQTTVKLK